MNPVRAFVTQQSISLTHLSVVTFSIISLPITLFGVNENRTTD